MSSASSDNEKSAVAIAQWTAVENRMIDCCPVQQRIEARAWLLQDKHSAVVKELYQPRNDQKKFVDVLSDFLQWTTANQKTKQI